MCLIVLMYVVYCNDECGLRGSLRRPSSIANAGMSFPRKQEEACLEQSQGTVLFRSKCGFSDPFDSNRSTQDSFFVLVNF